MSKRRVRNAVQSVLFRTYALIGHSMRRTRFGAWAFERAYLGYKLLIEAGPINRLAERITPGTWAIDVGANIGVFTVIFARRVASGGGVIAIEPEEQNRAVLRHRLKHAAVADRVVTFAGAAAERTAILHLKLNPEHPGDHRLAPDGVPVQATTIDELVAAQSNARVSLMKIDVQGAEMRVLQGARLVLERDNPALFIEIDDEALRLQGASAAELFDWLSRRGYTAYRLHRNGSISPIACGDGDAADGYVDVLFLNGKQSGTHLVQRSTAA